jgi:hypothetical protein
MNYGDGLYAGQFMGGMYAEAFFETDVQKIIGAGLKCIPAGSQYHECISDVLDWYQENPDDWQETWKRIENKYNLNPDYRLASCIIKEDPNYWRNTESLFNIDAKINGAYVVMGLLYGQGDPDHTIIIAARCGQDSDCNPSSAAGVLFTALGYSALPDKFTAALDLNTAFSHTPYTYPMLVDVCEKLARQTVAAAGGHIKQDADGEEVFVIPVEKVRPSRLVQCWQPGPIAGSRFAAEEMAQITVPQ